MPKRLIAIVLILGAAIAALLVSLLPSPSIAQSGQAEIAWLSQHSESPQSFEKVLGPKPLSFPKDLGPHKDYQTEWWYYTGNLESNSGRSFGYELTLFRRGLTPGRPPDQTNSTWRTNQVYFAHFTLSDIANKGFYPSERFSRGAAGLAGAQATPYKVWLEDWSIHEIEPGRVQLQAKTKDVAVDLVLEQTLPPILQGDRGYSIKGPEPGNASYYYSIVQQKTRGSIMVKDEPFDVTGVSWKDHEYSTSSLSAGTQGWDWFSVQFKDGSALMLYSLRQQDGSSAPQSSGTFVAADGTVQHLEQKDCKIEVLDHWTSPVSQTKYPAQWRISVPKIDLTLIGKPYMPEQELNISTTYWEGATHFEGTRNHQNIVGTGYVELTGYQQDLTF